MDNNSLNRFASLSDEDLESILDEKDSLNTKKVIKASVKIFEDYVTAKNIDFDPESTAIDELSVILKKFYAEVRKSNGLKYTKKSMVTLRFGLQKHFLKRMKVDIVNDERFKASNDLFKGVLVQLKKSGLGDSKYKEGISAEDLQKLYENDCFSKNSPSSLQRRVFFEYLYYYCNRGRENVRELQKEDFEVRCDAQGRRYITNTKTRQTKNHRGDDCSDRDEKEGRVCEIPGDERCPVSSFLLYLSKLHPDNNNLWQRPKKEENFNPDQTVWYDNVAVGKNTLGSIMSDLSEEAKLSKRYTNHCVRATSIQNLDLNGIETRHIMGFSGHRSESAVRSYTNRLGENKKREISDILNKCVQSKCMKSETTGNCIPPQKVPKLSVDIDTISDSRENVNTNSSNVTCTNNNYPDIDLLNEDLEFDEILKDISNYESQGAKAPSAHATPISAVSCSNTLQQFEIPNGISFHAINNATINFHFHK